jgi:hypothetical protein
MNRVYHIFGIFLLYLDSFLLLSTVSASIPEVYVYATPLYETDAT